MTQVADVVFPRGVPAHLASWFGIFQFCVRVNPGLAKHGVRNGKNAERAVNDTFYERQI